MSNQRPFDDYIVEYTLTDVEVEIHDTEHPLVQCTEVPALEITEGRFESYEYEEDGQDPPPLLDYHFFYQTPDFKEPSDRRGIPESEVVIRGTHPNGCRIEIGGPSFVYYERGTFAIDGTFVDPPKIVVLSGMPDDEEVGLPSAKIIPFKQPTAKQSA